MKSQDQGKEGSQAISRKDEGNHNKRAEEDKPEAPKPVIGMNDERGGVSKGAIPAKLSLLKPHRKAIETVLVGGLHSCIAQAFRWQKMILTVVIVRHGKTGYRSCQQQLADLPQPSSLRLLPRMRLERRP